MVIDLNSDSRKIIHVMLDQKFNDMAIRLFESTLSNVHEYWVTANAVTMTKSPLVRLCDEVRLSNEVSRPDVAGVIFHSMPPFRYPLLDKIPTGKVVVWLGWGHDYYSLFGRDDESSRILAGTSLLAQRPVSHRVKSKMKSVLGKLLRPVDYSDKSLARVDYFAPVLDLEFEMVKRHILLNASYIEWNYGTVEDDLSIPNAGFAQGVNILAGNSASATNNHVELFREIKRQIDLGGRRIIVPLSYGDPYYRDKIIKVGQDMFGELFVPLTDYLPIEEYLLTIRSCGFVVMNHLRQQAVGNVCMAMLMGAKVYLNERNPLSIWLGQRGAVFGAIDRLDMQPLTMVDRDVNYRLICSHWGRDVQMEKTRRLIDLILHKGSLSR